MADGRRGRGSDDIGGDDKGGTFPARGGGGGRVGGRGDGRAGGRGDRRAGGRGDGRAGGQVNGPNGGRGGRYNGGRGGRYNGGRGGRYNGGRGGRYNGGRGGRYNGGRGGRQAGQPRSDGIASQEMQRETNQLTMGFGKDDPPRGPTIGFNKLKELSTMDSDDAVLALVKMKGALKVMLQANDLKPDWVKLLIKVFALISESPMRSNVADLFSLLPGSPVIGSKLMQMIQEIPLREEAKERKELFLEDVLRFFESFSQMMPSSMSALPIAELPMVLKVIDLDKRESFLERTDMLLQIRLSLLEKTFEQAERKKKKMVISEGPPPEDFREISVEPTYEDIMPQTKPYLRPIKNEGQYTDGDEYLDIQFRLLREDLIAPLREGINEIAYDVASEKNNVGMKVYRNVRIIAPECSREGIVHRIKFDVGRLQSVQWKHSRRLIFGSLLCFSGDNFLTFLLAVVANRDPRDLAVGELDVRFLGGLEVVENINIFNAFEMVESPSFYEAYKHVLKALQTVDSNSIPFSDYIVSARNEADLPRYLQNQSSIAYDLEGCITKTNSPCNIKLSKLKDWKEKSVLNQSQLLAVEKALTREFVVIQGPPGTGKTFVGLRIVHALLKNEMVWQGVDGANILVVCYTNHALDQFLEGLLRMGHEKILRVGGRCKNEVLSDYTLAKKIEQDRSSGNRPSRQLKEVLAAKRQAEAERYSLKDGLKSAAGRLKKVQRFALQGRIFPVEYLLRYMPEHLQNWFEYHNSLCTKSSIPFLEIYLGLYPVPLEMVGKVRKEMKNGEIIRTNFNENDLIRRAGNVMADDEMVDIEGEVEALHDIWVVDQDEFKPEIDGVVEEDADIEDETEFTLVDSEGFQYVSPKKSERRARARQFIQYAEPMTDEDMSNIVNPAQLAVEGRWMLYATLISQYMQEARNSLVAIGNQYEEACSQVKEIERMKDEIFIRQGKVIAMTTTCAARYRPVLQRIKPKIIIIEEAAEVLEAHVVTSLTEGAEHVILIGDHKQLKPKPSVYKLAKDYQLELSLFERMIRNGMDCHRLDIQHRMRPEIARLLQDIYPNLEDHPSVTNYPNVNGVSKNVYMINHSFEENVNYDLKSKSNRHEAEYIVALCKYLLLQGYSPEQITVLTLYTGQLLILKGMMPKSVFNGVRVAAVDNFQGEECDIILLSLVRSNKNDSIGFSGVENRICVALSRAKHGLFVIGNFPLLAKKSEMWSKIVEYANDSGIIGASLRLFCRNHPDRSIDAVLPADFKDAPEGGCKEPCAYRLKCGHVCQRTCHPVDQEHQNIICWKKCEQLACGNNHRCAKPCHHGTECGPCQVLVSKIVPDCGHEQRVACFMDPHNFKCKYMLEKALPCGHFAEIECHREDLQNVWCQVPCKMVLECGHECSGSCSGCRQNRLHDFCRRECNRVLVCSHLCKEPCSKECPPCREACNVRCTHSKCSKLCGEVCPPCREKCQWKCKHKQCNRLCSEICNRGPCNKPCQRKVKKCGHPCIGLCGETCPKLCRICDKKEVQEIFFGDEDEDDARFLQLKDCFHIFEVKALDKWMVGEADAQKQFVKMRSCPKCSVPIRTSLRYGNIIKKQIQDVNAVKKKLIDERKSITEEKALNDVYASLCKTSFASADQSGSSYKKICKLVQSKIDRFCNASLSSFEIISVNQIGLLKRVALLVEAVAETLRKVNKNVKPDAENLMHHCFLVTKICLRNGTSVQEIMDSDLELKRLFLYNTVVDTLNCSCRMPIRSQQKLLLQSCLDELKSGRRMERAAIEARISDVEKVRKRNGMGALTEDEKQMVIKAMGFSAGHWYKCPNGHFYAIGECGGASQESKCPECKEKIGGTGHRLVAGNAHAGEFDGSRHAAWSEAANLENFDPQEFF